METRQPLQRVEYAHQKWKPLRGKIFQKGTCLAAKLRKRKIERGDARIKIRGERK